MIPASAQAPTGATLIEIRSTSGRILGLGADLMPETVAARVQRMPHVVKIEKFLFFGLRDRGRPGEIFVCFPGWAGGDEGIRNP